MTRENMLKRTEDRLGSLTLAVPVDFSFAWRGRRVTARVDGDEGATRLTLIADLGAMPFTSEAADQRARLQGVLRWSQRREGQRLLLRRGRMLLAISCPFDAPLLADEVLVRSVMLLLEGRPMARLVDEIRKAEGPLADIHGQSSAALA